MYIAVLNIDAVIIKPNNIMGLKLLTGGR